MRVGSKRPRAGSDRSAAMVGRSARDVMPELPLVRLGDPGGDEPAGVIASSIDHEEPLAQQLPSSASLLLFYFAFQLVDGRKAAFTIVVNYRKAIRCFSFDIYFSTNRPQ